MSRLPKTKTTGGALVLIFTFAAVLHACMHACSSGNKQTQSDPRVEALATWGFECAAKVLDKHLRGRHPPVKVHDEVILIEGEGVAEGHYDSTTNVVRFWINTPNSAEVMLHEMVHVWIYLLGQSGDSEMREAYAEKATRKGLAVCRPAPDVEY